LPVTVPPIEEGQATKSWVPRPSMEDEINGHLWAPLALYEAFRVIREYDTSFVTFPYKTGHRIPSEVPGCGLCWDKLYHEIISDQTSVSGMIQFMPDDSFTGSAFSWYNMYQDIMQVHSCLFSSMMCIMLVQVVSQYYL
jgi:hypothetical protein